MKKLLCAICMCLFTVMFLSSCNSEVFSGSENLMNGVEPDEDQTYSFVNGETSSPNSYTSFTNAANNFAFSMLSSLYKSGENTAFSSSALFTQMALLENAASGDNQKEIKQLVGKNISVDNLNSCVGYFSSRLNALNDDEDKYYVNIENAIFFNEGNAVNSSFLVMNANYFNQGMFRLDFSDENSLTKINTYFKEATLQKSSDILTSLDSENDIYALGTAYMKDKWLDGYSNENITTMTFEGSSGDVEANFMQSTEYYVSGKNCTGFVKNFKNTPCKFVALLPDDDTTVYELAKSLDNEKYSSIMSSMDTLTTCDTYLPQFSVSDTVSFKDALKKNNVDIMFTPEADFSNLSYGKKASVADVIQSFSLDITQGGIGTTKVNQTDTEKNEPEYTVSLTRPFIFIIADNESNIPIYIGIISNI